MGTLRSTSDCTGLVVNGVTLGQPTFTDEIDPNAPPLFAWDDSRLPDGVVGDNGEIILDQEDDV